MSFYKAEFTADKDTLYKCSENLFHPQLRMNILYNIDIKLLVWICFNQCIGQSLTLTFQDMEHIVQNDIQKYTRNSNWQYCNVGPNRRKVRQGMKWWYIENPSVYNQSFCPLNEQSEIKENIMASSSVQRLFLPANEIISCILESKQEKYDESMLANYTKQFIILRENNNNCSEEEECSPTQPVQPTNTSFSTWQILLAFPLSDLVCLCYSCRDQSKESKIIQMRHNRDWNILMTLGKQYNISREDQEIGFGEYKVRLRGSELKKLEYQTTWEIQNMISGNIFIFNTSDVALFHCLRSVERDSNFFVIYSYPSEPPICWRPELRIMPYGFKVCTSIEQLVLICHAYVNGDSEGLLNEENVVQSLIKRFNEKSKEIFTLTCYIYKTGQLRHFFGAYTGSSGKRKLVLWEVVIGTQTYYFRISPKEFASLLPNKELLWDIYVENSSIEEAICEGFLNQNNKKQYSFHFPTIYIIPAVGLILLFLLLSFPMVYCITLLRRVSGSYSIGFSITQQSHHYVEKKIQWHKILFTAFQYSLFLVLGCIFTWYLKTTSAISVEQDIEMWKYVTFGVLVLTSLLGLLILWKLLLFVEMICISTSSHVLNSLLDWLLIKISKFYLYIIISLTKIVRILIGRRINTTFGYKMDLAFLTKGELEIWKKNANTYTKQIVNILNQHEMTANENFRSFVERRIRQPNDKYCLKDIQDTPQTLEDVNYEAKMVDFIHTGSIPERFGKPIILMREIDSCIADSFQELNSDHDVMFELLNQKVTDLVVGPQVDERRFDASSIFFSTPISNHPQDVEFVHLRTQNYSMVPNTIAREYLYNTLQFSVSKGLQLDLFSDKQKNGVQPQLSFSYQGPSLNMKIESGQDLVFDCDLLLALPLVSWPKCADNWIKRPRKWPDAAAIQEMVKLGCHFIPKPKYEGDNFCWRYSFSRQELFLSTLVPMPARRVYVASKFIFKKILKPYTQLLKSYHLKTIFFWYLEKKGVNYWSHENFEQDLHLFMKEILYCLGEITMDGYDARCPHYFIDQVDLFKPLGNNVKNKFSEVRKYLREALELDSKKFAHKYLYDSTANVAQYLRPELLERQNKNLHLNNGEEFDDFPKSSLKSGMSKCSCIHSLVLIYKYFMLLILTCVYFTCYTAFSLTLISLSMMIYISGCLICGFCCLVDKTCDAWLASFFPGKWLKEPIIFYSKVYDHVTNTVR